MSNGKEQFQEIHLNSIRPVAEQTLKNGDENNKNGVKKRRENEDTILIRSLNKFYRKWAVVVVKYRYAIIAICSALSTLGAIKIVTTPFENDLNGWTPYGARSLDEAAISDRFFNKSDPGGAITILLIVMPKVRGRNMLGREILEEVMRVDDLINWNITLQNHVTNKSEGFAEFCRDFCDINEPVRLFMEGFKSRQLAKTEADQALQKAISLDYPNINVRGRKANIQPYFHGIVFANGSSANTTTSTTASPNPLLSNMISAEMVTLVYKAERAVAGLSIKEMKEYELKVSKYFQNEFNSSLVRVLSISPAYAEAEFVRASLSLLPYLGVGFVVMVICTSISIPISAAYFQQASIHKPIDIFFHFELFGLPPFHVSLAISACLCPFMASGTALGLLLLCGLRYSAILCVTPFLVLAIGVDAAFLMSHAWNRFAKKCPNSAEREDGRWVAETLASTMIDTVPSILVSALANILADAIGTFIGSPEITLLCVSNMVALAINFGFQCTYFVAAMSIVALEEQKGQKSETVAGKHGRVVTWQLRFHERAKNVVSSVVDVYASLISNCAVALLISFAWILFIVFSAIEISNFEVNMTNKQLYAQDSPLIEVETIRENQITPTYTMATVFISDPGNLSDPTRLSRIDQLVRQMEHLPESWGEQSTMYFVRDLAEYSRKTEEEGKEEEENGRANKTGNGTPKPNQFDCTHLRDFLDATEYSHWKGFIRLATNNNNKNRSMCSLDRFFFTTAFHDVQLSKWSKRVELLKEWRRKVDDYGSEVGASVFHDEGIYFDLMDNMPTDTWQSAAATLICMAFICLLMLNDWQTVAASTAVIAAIITETLGILSWTGEALNQLMIGSLIISIGFSVDLPAHFSYHYLTAGLLNANDRNADFRQRLSSTIRSVGLPSIQASLSTSLCVLSQYWVKLYIGQIFVRIMCLTILLCVTNTLLVLPALLTLSNSAIARKNRK